jgi:hypothetical protein
MQGKNTYVDPMEVRFRQILLHHSTIYYFSLSIPGDHMMGILCDHMMGMLCIYKDSLQALKSVSINIYL